MKASSLELSPLKLSPHSHRLIDIYIHWLINLFKEVGIWWEGPRSLQGSLDPQAVLIAANITSQQLINQTRKGEGNCEKIKGIVRGKMFFFFVGGLEQQVRQVLKTGAGRCIRCGSRADLVEYEKVLKLFFVPVWRWPGKEPFMRCNNCNLFFPPSFSLPPPPAESRPPPPTAVLDIIRCQFCGREVDTEFKFCPFCGSAL